jgi:hypothetical protein
VALSRASRVSLVGNMAAFMKPYTRDSSNNRLRQTLGPWTRPDQRIWPVYYDSSSQMLCQMVQTPQHLQRPVLLTPLGSTTQQGSRPRRFAVSKDASFQDSRPPPDAVPVTSLKHLPYSGVPFRHCRPRLAHDAIRDPKVATFADYVAALPL